eukprot:3836797-Amphidinium_carterae.1
MRDTLAPFGDYALVAEANMIGLQLMVFVSAQQKQHVKDVRTGNTSERTPKFCVAGATGVVHLA